MRVGLGLRLRRIRLRHRPTQLAKLVVEVGQRAGCIGVLEPDRGRAPLDLARVEERRQRFGHVVEDPLAPLLLCLDPLPVLAHAARSACLHRTEDVRVAPHELFVYPPRDLPEVADALLLEQ